MKTIRRGHYEERLTEVEFKLTDLEVSKAKLEYENDELKQLRKAYQELKDKSERDIRYF